MAWESPWSFLLKFWQFEQLQLNKVFLAQCTSMGYLCTETLKGGQVGENRGGQKGGVMWWAMDAALHPESHSRGSTRTEGKLSLERRRISYSRCSLLLGVAKRFSGSSCRREQYKLSLIPLTWTRTQHKGIAVVTQLLTFQTEKQSSEVLLCSLPELFFAFDVVLSANPWTNTTKSLFTPEQMVHSMTGPKVEAYGGPHGVTITRKEKQHKWLPHFPSPTHPPTWWLHWRQGLDMENSTGISQD